MITAASSFFVRRVTEATDLELQAADKLLGEAFREDPFAEALTGGDASIYGAAFVSSIIAALLSDSGEVYFAESAEKEIAGVAVWFKPGRALYDTEDQRAKSLEPMMAKVTPELQEWWTTVLIPAYEELASKNVGKGTKLGAWHLQTFAVAPQWQGKGVARALIEVVKKKAFETGKALTVETATPLNVQIYQKFGFKVMGEPATIKGLTKSYQAWILLQEPPNKV